MNSLGLIGLFGLIGLTGLLNKVHPSQPGSSIRLLGLLGFLGLAGFWVPSLGACGAFGALGGDLSAININPAGSAVFIDNQYGFTLSSEKKENKTIFFNSSVDENDNKFSFNQGGAVWILKNSGGGNINKISFGFNAQTNNSYKNNFEINLSLIHI